MSKPSDPSTALRPGDVVRNKFPLRFEEHTFAAYCYNAIGCHISYHGFPYFADDQTVVAPPPATRDYRSHWSGFEPGIKNFPAPVIAKWKSLDGVAHEARVDIAAIFSDQLILHNVAESDLPDGAGQYFEPDIFVEINDHVVNVYMQAMIPTKDLQIAGNTESNFRNDLILAWSNTY